MERRVDGLVGGADVTDATGTARAMKSDAGVTAGALDFAVSHVIPMDGRVTWVTVCTDSSGFRGDSSGWVVPAESAGADGRELPRPCIVAAAWEFLSNHLWVFSVDGGVKMRIRIPDINWKDWIRGLGSHGPQLFIAQPSAVSVTDLSGHVIVKIRSSKIPDFGDIRGISVNAVSIFISSREGRVAAVSRDTGQLQTVFQIPAAGVLGNMAELGDCIFITDWEHGQVYKVHHIEAHQLIAAHPTQRAGLERFMGPADVAVDSRGRVFVCECGGHSVRALDAGSGALLGTLGTPGEAGSGRHHLHHPQGLAAVTAGGREQLLVADQCNMRLLVVNINCPTYSP